MKDNISMIFAAIIGTLLIVILPLYSVLDRQDSMAYNVVLTQTTNFVDSIRNNGFIDKDSYYNYLASLSSTANSYKVKLEAYRKRLIPDLDSEGNVIPDTYVEEIELYNTQDIIDALEQDANDNADNSNKKNNVYLFDVNDEIYVKVYNTNITAGSIIYRLLAGEVDSKVIDISYGGVVNKINWELYDVINSSTSILPLVELSVPLNENNVTNILKVDTENESDVACVSGASLTEQELLNPGVVLCEDLVSDKPTSYKYLFDLDEQANKTIKISVEFVNFDTVNVDTNVTKTLTELYNMQEENNANLNAYKSYILNNYIQLNGMYAKKDIVFRKPGSYYALDIVLTDVRMAYLDYLYSLASVAVLPGIGQDSSGVASLGSETVQIELTNSKTTNDVAISNPIGLLKLQNTKSVNSSVASTVYANQDIIFVISYKGINNQLTETIKEAIKNNLAIYPIDATQLGISEIELYTPNEFQKTFGVNLQVTNAIIVKYHYTSSNDFENYIELADNWIATNIEEEIDIEQNENYSEYSVGAKSSKFSVLSDNVGPETPDIMVNGTLGDNGWYKSQVTFSVISGRDRIYRPIVDSVVIGGSGVYRTLVSLAGANTMAETTVKSNQSISLNKEGTTTITAKTYDYVGNVSDESSEQVKIDMTAPTNPVIKVVGPEIQNGWYSGDVDIVVIPGSDKVSGIAKTTIEIKGTAALVETVTTSARITSTGKNTVIARSYDKAGNVAETTAIINIDKAVPKDATIQVVSGVKEENTEYYRSNVTLLVNLNVSGSISGLGNSEYEVIGPNNISKTAIVGESFEVKLTENGTHKLVVYTRTKAGNVKTTEFEVKIDKKAPNPPSIKSIVGILGDNDWYTSNVEVVVKSGNDVGDSNFEGIYYSIVKDEEEGTLNKTNDGATITLTEEGSYKLRVYSKDNAGNMSYIEKDINIDKSDPESAEFVISGDEGQNGWYTSAVTVGSNGGKDEVSGIAQVEITPNEINTDTQGTEVVMTTKDNAGRTVTKSTTIKIDTIYPTIPVINLPAATGSGIVGVNMYNDDVAVTITPGTDTNYSKTTYEVTTNDGEQVVAETEGTEYTLKTQGAFTFIARSYDYAGNCSTSSTVIVINKTNDSPKILSINGTDVSKVNTKTITGTDNKIDIEVNNLDYGNLVTIVIENQTTYISQEFEFTANSNKITEQITLAVKGKYKIKVKQKNMYGTITESTGNYYYIYE